MIALVAAASEPGPGNRSHPLSSGEWAAYRVGRRNVLPREAGCRPHARTTIRQAEDADASDPGFATRGANQARRRVDDFRDRRRIWRETEDRIARLTGGLRRSGLGKGDRAAILALNSDRYFEYLFAVPAAGGITVPLNTRLAPPEIAYILEDSGASMLFIDAAFAPRAGAA